MVAFDHLKTIDQLRDTPMITSPSTHSAARSCLFRLNTALPDSTLAGESSRPSHHDRDH
jgi:hypothetical protein